MPVTEEEIDNGILSYEQAKEGCFWFHRNITDLQENAKSKMARRFMDISGDIDQEAFDLLTELKYEPFTLIQEAFTLIQKLSH